MENKTSIYLCIFLSASFAVGYYFVLGKRGIHEYFSLQKKIESKMKQISSTRDEIYALNNTITQWQAGTFELEKLCREKLQMGQPEEFVYINAHAVTK